MAPEKHTAANLINRYRPAEIELRRFYQLLHHTGYGVTELRIFAPRPLVAYADNEDNFVQLCREKDGKVSGVYTGVNPRPVDFMAFAPNRWQPARGGPRSNCTGDNDIEWVTACFIDIDIDCPTRPRQSPATESELEPTLQLARLIAASRGFDGSAVIACSGNGHYVIAPVIPIPVDDEDLVRGYRGFYRYLTGRFAGKVPGARLDNVANLSRVMRAIGTVNMKGTATGRRPYRQSYFTGYPEITPSLGLYYLITQLAAETGPAYQTEKKTNRTGIRADLTRLEACEFIRWCRRYPELVSEPQWFGLLSNLANLEGGPELAHALSALDKRRYRYQQTQALIQRIRQHNYRPVQCKHLVSPVDKTSGGRIPGYGYFTCSRLLDCPVRAPMYLAALRTVYQR